MRSVLIFILAFLLPACWTSPVSREDSRARYGDPGAHSANLNADPTPSSEDTPMRVPDYTGEYRGYGGGMQTAPKTVEPPL